MGEDCRGLNICFSEERDQHSHLSVVLFLDEEDSSWK